MKASQVQNALVLFVVSTIRLGEVRGISIQEENKTERQGGYIRQRNLSHCPHTAGTPCWGVQICRSGKPACVAPFNVFNNDVCGDCKTNINDTSEIPQENTGYQETGNGVIKGNDADSIPTLYNPKDTNCPRSETYPCYGIPVCRMESGKGVNFCVQPDSVFKSDKCGYCDDNGGTDIQETNGGGDGTKSQNDPDDGFESTGDQETGNGIITGNVVDSNPTVNIPNAANCPRSGTYPCYGIPVCRMESGHGVNFCVEAGSVFETDKCGYCDDVGGTDNQEDDGVGNATLQDIESPGDQKTGNGGGKKKKGKSKQRGGKR